MFAFFTKSRWSASEFQALLAEHGDRWYRACLRLTRDHALAEDAVQEALIKAWEKREQYRGESELAGWVHRIAVNCALDLLHRRGKHADALPSDNLLADASETGDDGSDGPSHAVVGTPLEQAQRLESARQLESAMRALSDMERTCFVLKHLEQYRLEEIADQINSSVNSVKQALFRAAGKLRSSLTALGVHQ